jgi:hypothetical protein
VERNLIFVGLLLLFQHFGVLVMTLILRKKIKYFLYAGYIQGLYWLRFSTLLQREGTRGKFCLASKALEVVARTPSLTMGGKTIIDFAFDFLYI